MMKEGQCTNTKRIITPHRGRIEYSYYPTMFMCIANRILAQRYTTSIQASSDPNVTNCSAIAEELEGAKAMVLLL